MYGILQNSIHIIELYHQNELKFFYKLCILERDELLIAFIIKKIRMKERIAIDDSMNIVFMAELHRSFDVIYSG